MLSASRSGDEGEEMKKAREQRRRQQRRSKMMSTVNRVWLSKRVELEDWERFEPQRKWEEAAPLSLVRNQQPRTPPMEMCLLLGGALCWIAFFLAVGFIPYLVNWNRNSTTWQDTTKSRMVPSDSLLIGAWFIMHCMIALAAWYVWMDGAFTKQSRSLLSVFILAFVDILFPDIVFGSASPGAGTFWFLVMFGVAIMVAWVLGKIITYSAVLVVPFAIGCLYAAIMCTTLTHSPSAIV